MPTQQNPQTYGVVSAFELTPATMGRLDYEGHKSDFTTNQIARFWSKCIELTDGLYRVTLSVSF